MASGRSKHMDPDQQMADAMKQVKKAMKQVKEATKGMGSMHTQAETYHPPPAGFRAPPPKSNDKMGGSIKIEKRGLFGKNTQINIQSSKNVQIGDNNVMVINQTSSRRKQHRRRKDSNDSSSDEDDDQPSAKGNKPVLTQAHRDMLSSERLVNDSDVRTGSKFMAKSWRRIGRSLSLSDTELEQIHTNHFREEGIQGVGYQVIQTWRQKAGRGATLGALTSAICKAYPPEEVLQHFTP